MDQTITPSAAPGYGDLAQGVEGLSNLISHEADAAEKLRHMSDTTYAALHEKGLVHMMTPRALGGSELAYSDGLSIAESVSRIDGSTGWNVMVSGVQHGTCGSLITETGRKDVFAAGTDTNIAGQGIPRGFARRVDGGYMIKGDWGYGSGIFHSNWVHSGCILMEDGQPVMDKQGSPIVLITYVPRDAIELKDNWDVIGLRGTGSFDYSIAEELFVPNELTYLYSKNDVERGGYHYSLGIVGFTAWGHTSFALGVGRHALDMLAVLAREKAGPFGILADSSSFQEKYAHAEAQYRAARALVYSVWNDLDETLLNEEPPTNEQIALIKLAFRYSHDVMSELTTFAYKGGGGIALRAGPLQRAYRDLHAGLQHVLLSDQIVQDCGKVLMGHAPEGATMQLLGLH